MSIRTSKSKEHRKIQVANNQLINPFATELFFGFRRNLNMLFSTMCWLFCYCFLIILDTTVHHISTESEDM